MREICVGSQSHKCLGVLQRQRPEPILEPFIGNGESSDGDGSVSLGTKEPPQGSHF